MNKKQVTSEIYKSTFFPLISWTNKWQCVLALLAVGSEGGGKGKEVTQCVQVNATRWPHGDSSLQTLEESCAHSKGLILNSLDTSNTRIKIEAPEGFSKIK